VDTTAPTVDSVSPADGATEVGRDINVEATFSEAMDASTINSSTFTLAKRNADGTTNPVAAAVGYDSVSKKATLNPDASLDVDATYTATVRSGGAKDASGNSLPENKTWSFATVKPADTTPPDTFIDSSPSGTVANASADFTFSSSEAGSTFQCSLDGAAFTSCSSPQKYTGLTEGSHTFEVRATDAAGNTDPTSASGTWRVDTVAPTAQPPAQSLINGSTLGTNTVPVNLAWSATDLQSSVSQYQLQRLTSNGRWVDETLSPVTLTSKTFFLTPGKTYQYRVRAMDGAGNWSDWAQGQQFFVDDYQETSSAITYSGTWTKEALTNAYGGSVEYSVVAGDTAKFTFTGSEVAWVSSKLSDRGQAEVWIDGVKVTTVDLFSSSAQYRKVVFTKSWASVGTHTLEVRVSGTAGRPRVDVDDFTVIR